MAPGDDLPGAIVSRPGGVALNIALALARRGNAVRLIAPIGDDPDGAALIAALRESGVTCARIATGAATGRYMAVENADGALIAAIADLPGCDSVRVRALAPHLAPAAAWVIDGNLPAEAIAALAAAAGPALLAANPASPAKACRLAPVLARIDLLFCNRAEAEALTDRRFDAAIDAARALADLGVTEAVVTDGPRAAAALDATGASASLRPEPAGATARLAVTGAGDALLAAHLHARLAGAPLRAALVEGLAAARAILEAGEMKETDP